MTYTTLPTVKGQITIPAPIRKKYTITENTPILFEDNGDGIVQLRIMKVVPHTKVDAQYFENEKEFGLIFKNGIDPLTLIDLLK